jgi:hypothetical protein
VARSVTFSTSEIPVEDSIESPITVVVVVVIVVVIIIIIIIIIEIQYNLINTSSFKCKHKATQS